MPVRTLLRRWRDDRGGATAIEYAMVLPVFAMLVLGVINTSQLASVISGMHFAVQEAARCSAVNEVVCGNADATVAFARGRYVGPRAAPTFVSTNDGCGHTVRATANFELNVAIMSFDVPLSAEACYPGAGEEEEA
jgi:Flp pilus assembly protein TadG